MEISTGMDLTQLAERMGSVATREDARAMRDVLVESSYSDTRDIPAREWLEMMERAVSAADAAVYALDWTSANRQSSMDMGQYETIQAAIDAQPAALAEALSQGFDDSGRWSVLDESNTAVAKLRPENGEWSIL